MGVIFESTPEGIEGSGHAGLSGKSHPGREDSKSKVPELGACLAFKKQPEDLWQEWSEQGEG